MQIGRRHNEHHQPSRIEQPIGFVGEEVLRLYIFDGQVVGWISEDNVELHLGVVEVHIVNGDVGIRIETLCYFYGVLIDVETVGIVFVGQMIEEITHTTTHIEHGVGDGRSCHFNHSTTYFVGCEKLP